MSRPPKNKVAPRVVEDETKAAVVDVDTTTEVDQEEAESVEKLNLFQSQFSGKAYKVRIEKYDRTDSTWEWCDRLPLEGFDPFTVAKKFGGGKYKCVLLDDGGRYVEKGRMEFVLATPPEPEKPVLQAALSPLQDPTVQLLIESMKGQSVMLMELMKASLSRPQEPRDDLAKMIEAVKSLKGLSPEEKDAGKSVRETIALALQLKELAGGDGGGEKGGILSEAMEALKLVTSLRGTAQVQPPSVPRPIVRQPAPFVAPVPEESSTMPKAVEEALFYVPKFANAALRGDDTEKWAEFLLDILDREIVPSLVDQYKTFGVTEEAAWEKLTQAAKSPEAVEKILLRAPSLRPHQAWVGSVIKKAAEIAENEGVETVAAGAETITDGEGE